jgi:hypothetical protein
MIPVFVAGATGFAVGGLIVYFDCHSVFDRRMSRQRRYRSRSSPTTTACAVRSSSKVDQESGELTASRLDPGAPDPLCGIEVRQHQHVQETCPRSREASSRSRSSCSISGIVGTRSRYPPSAMARRTAVPRTALARESSVRTRVIATAPGLRFHPGPRCIGRDRLALRSPEIIWRSRMPSTEIGARGGWVAAREEVIT